MTVSDEYRRRQEDEVIAISSMYPDEFEDLRKQDAWKVWRPPEIAIRVLDPTDKGDDVRSVRLVIKMSSNYPDSIPELGLNNERGLSVTDLKQLTTDMLERAGRLRGQEMVMDLVLLVSSFLTALDRPMFRSLHEETAYHARRAAATAAEQRRAQLECDANAAELRRAEILQVQEQRQRELKKQRRRHRNSLASVDGVSSLVSSGAIDGCRYPPSRCIVFESRGQEEVVCGRSEGLADRQSVVFFGVDRISGASLRLQEFSYKLPLAESKKNKRDNELCNKEKKFIKEQMLVFEREFIVLSKLEHDNIVKYTNMMLVDGNESIEVVVCQEWPCGFDVCGYLKGAPDMELSQLRRVTADLCSAVSYLHGKDVLHRDIRCSSVFVCPGGVVRLADFSLSWRLAELARRNGANQTDLYPPCIGRGGKRADIHRLGIVLLSLAQGFLVQESEPTIPAVLPPALVDFLRRCLLRDEQARWTADQLLEHSFLKLPLLKTVNGAAPPREESVRIRPLSPPPSTAFEVGCSERLQNEYDILEHVGKGGYGSVIKVRHKLDGQLYAIKQVLLDPAQPRECQKIIKEAIVLSRLQHDNIVRYFSAWKGSRALEKAADVDSNINQRVAPDKMNSTDQIEYVKSPPETMASLSSQWNVSSRNEVDIDSDSSSDSGAWCPAPVAPHEPSGESVVFDGGSGDNNGDMCDPESERESTHPSADQPAQEIQYLFIQMEFCEKKTLRTAILDGLHADQQRLWKLFREILEGLHYVHRQGLIHRDLKPDNVFLQDTGHGGASQDYRAKLGDFGLAVSKERRAAVEPGSLSIVSGAVRLDKSQPEAFEFTVPGVGTAHYRAPELCTASGSRQYTNKVDIYSLGVIFFEMCRCAFDTLTERCHVLERLRLPDVQLPEDISRWMTDQQVELVCWMLRHDPGARPGAGELLGCDLVPPHSREEALFSERLQQALVRPSSTRYKRLMEACFARRPVQLEDELYDSALAREVTPPCVAALVQLTRDRLVDVFRRFGAVPFSLPLLAPIAATAAESLLPDSGDHSETLMNSNGALLQLPRSLRSAAARLIGRTAAPPGRHYALESIFVRQRPSGMHPRQHLEALYAVLAPQGSSLPDAELLAVAAAVLAAFPGLDTRSYMLCVGHTLLLEAALTSAHVPSVQWPLLIDRLAKHQRFANQEQVQSVLSGFGLPQKCLSRLATLLVTRCGVGQVAASFRGRSQVTEMCRQAVHELEAVISGAEAMGVDCQIQVHIGLTFGSDQRHFCGPLMQLVRWRESRCEVLGVGGRCDPLLAAHWHLRPRDAPLQPPALVCLSVHFDRCVAAAGAELTAGNSDSSPVLQPAAVPFQVVVVAPVSSGDAGERAAARRQVSLVRQLRAAGLRTYLYIGDGAAAAMLDGARVWARAQGARALLLPKPADHKMVLVRCLDARVASDKPIPVADLVGYLAGVGVCGHGHGDGAVKSADKFVGSGGSCAGGGDPASAGGPSGQQEVSLQVRWLTTSGGGRSGGGLRQRSRAELNAERLRFEHSARRRLRGECAALGCDARVEVLVVDLAEPDLQQLTALRVNAPDAEFRRSAALVRARCRPDRLRAVDRLCEHAAVVRAQRCVLILYSIVDDSRRTLHCAGADFWK